MTLNVKDDSDIRLVYQCYVISLLIPGIGKAVFSVQGPQRADQNYMSRPDKIGSGSQQGECKI